MNDKKHIDRLFQEKFKDFEVEPPELVWKNIESALTQKKRRRAIPFWLQSTGVAAILIVGAILYSLFTNSPSNPETQIVRQINIDAGTDDATKLSAPDAVVSTEFAEQPSAQSDANNTDVTLQKASENTVAITAGAAQLSQKDQPSVKSDSKRPAISLRTTMPNEQSKRNSKESNMHGSTTAPQSGLADIDVPTLQPVTSAAAQLADRDKNDSTEPKQTTQSAIANKKVMVLTETQIKVAAVADSTEDKLDTTNIASVVPNALEELLKENEKEEKIAETNLNRWQVTSSVAPIYFSSASNGSPIDGAFANNDKSYDKNLSVGLGINYALNKKLSVRTGVNKFTLGYNTKDVVFFAGLNANNFDNLTPAANSADIVVMTEGAATADLMPFETGISNINEGSINQRMGYLEVPIEMSYKLLDQKFGISIIGGLSTLFLNENRVTVVSSGMSASLGSANNLNEVHFSSNVGLGLNYTFWKSFQFNFEPMFKYQINTFTRDSGNFKPYFIGLYSGLSFRF